MGWKLSSIIINQATDVNYEHLLGLLGFTNLKRIEEQPYDFAMYPEYNNIYIRNYKGNLIICAENLPLEFFTQSICTTERIRPLLVFPA